MFVIHPEDASTAFLSLIYDGIDGVVVDNRRDISSNEMSRKLNALPKHESVMILGHGCGMGLFSRDNDCDAFARILVGHAHAYYLRRHSVIGVWCNARDFASEHGLHGLFTGMFISEIDEASAYGVETTIEELAMENERFAMRLRWLIGQNVPLSQMPEMLREKNVEPTPLTRFNYEAIVYM